MLLGVAAIVLSATAAVRWDRTRVPSIAAQLSAATLDEGRFRAVVVFQYADCGSSLGFLSWLRQHSDLSHMRLERLLHVGPQQEFAAAERWSEESELSLPVRHADASLQRALAALGQRQTPWILLLDRHGQVRLSLDAPRSPAERRQVVSALSAFTSSSLAPRE